MRRALLTLALAGGLAVTGLSGPAFAGQASIVDNADYDVPHPDVDMTRLTVGYNAKGARAVVRFEDLQRRKRLRIFVAFFNQPAESQYDPYYGNFVELRIDEKARIKRVNWLVDPDDGGSYTRQRCRGIKVRPDFKRGLITYTLPKRCAHYLPGKGYIKSYASARKFKARHWDEGSPADTTGDWFDTTYDLRVPR